MTRVATVLVAGLSLSSAIVAAQAPTAGPYKVTTIAKVGGDGGFDYVYADAANRRLYIPRGGPNARVSVFDLDTLAQSPASFVVEQTVETMVSAKTLTLDSTTNRILPIAAESGPPTPPTTPGGRPGRGPMIPGSFSILVVSR